MKVGIDTFSFHIAMATGNYDVFRTLDWLADLGFAGLQININGPEGRFLGADPSDAAHVRRVRAAIEKKGFFVEVGGRCTEPEMLRWQLQLCADLGGDVLRTLVSLKEDLPSTLEQTRRDLEQSLPFAASLGVVIAVENHEDITAAELRQLLDLIPHGHLGACVDTGNDLVLYGNPLEAARQLAGRAATSHIKDHKLVQMGTEVRSIGVPFGSGDIDLPPILKLLENESPLDRILLQDTTGYSAPLNPVNRTDIHPSCDYASLPTYTDEAALRVAGLHPWLENLSAVELLQLAQQQEKNIIQDLAYLRALGLGG